MDDSYEKLQKQKRTTRRDFKTKKEANLEFARIQLQIANGEFKQEKVDTFQDVYNLWIKQHKDTVESSTFAKHKPYSKSYHAFSR